MNSTNKTFWHRIRDLLGIETTPVSHAERLVSIAGGFVGILLVLVVSHQFVGGYSAALIVASMGASAVLLFAVPHGVLSQPWSVAGGHLVSALVGITCARYVPQTFVAAALAVGLAIGAMHYLRCIHPPGGATALVAVVGGASIHELGYGFVITPVLLNVMVILLTAVAFNYLWHWRRYPASLAVAHHATGGAPEPAYAPMHAPEHISHADLVYALSQIDSFIDVSENDLLRIYQLATHCSQLRHLDAEQIGLGRYYSNGAEGEQWQVRQIVDESPNQDSDKDIVIYKVVDGPNRRSSATMTRREFACWGQYEVSRNGDAWQRLDDGGD